jgi:hypothetical protein
MNLNYQDPIRSAVNVNLQQYINSIETVTKSLGMQCLVLDNKNKILYASDNFCKTVGIQEPELIGKTVTQYAIPKLAMYSQFADQVTQQHQEIIANNQRRIFLEINTTENQSEATISHKTPIYDADGNFLCLHIQFKPFTIARLANLGVKFHGVKSPKLEEELKEITLSRVQQMVIYLYARNYSYTEVATWITRFGHKISPTAVNKQLAKLKTIFNVPDNEGLKDMSLKLGYDIAVPAEFLPAGIHDITEDVFDLWIC